MNDFFAGAGATAIVLICVGFLFGHVVPPWWFILWMIFCIIGWFITL